MKLIQHRTLKNFYLPDNGSKFLVFSLDTSKTEFLLTEAFVSFSFDFLIVFYKDAIFTIDELLRQKLAKGMQQLGRTIVWIDQIGSTDINLCPSIQIISKNQASGFARISFGADEHVIYLEHRDMVGMPKKATVTYDDANIALVFKVNDDKKHGLVANKSSKSEYAAFVIPLSHQQTLFGLNSRATTDNAGSICFLAARPLANAVQPRTALLSPDVQNNNVLFSYQYFDDASYSQNTDLLGIIYPSVDFDNNATEFRSYIEVFIQEPLSTNFLDEFGNKYEIPPKGRTLVSRIAFVNGSPAGNPLSQNFFFAPVGGETLEMEASGTQLLLGLSGTERQDRTKLEFLEYKDVLYTQLPGGEIKPSPHAGSLTSITISPKFLTDNDGLRYYIDAEKAPLFDNEKTAHTLVENTSREVPYDAVRIGSIAKQREIPIIPTLSFSGNSNLKELEKLLVKRRLVNAVQMASVKAITPQGFQRDGNKCDFIKNDQMHGLDADDPAFHFTITNANLDFNLSIAKEDVFFVTTPALLKDANFKDHFDIFFGIHGFKIDLLLKNVTSQNNSEKVIVFKFSRHSVDELMGDTSKWSNHGDFRKTDLSLVQKEMKLQFARFEQKFDPSGKRNQDYLYIDQTIRRDPHWNGVFVLNIPIGNPKNLPDIFTGLASSQELDSYENPPKNPAPGAKRQFKTGLKFEYVAFPVNQTGIKTGGLIDIKSTSFYGLVDYDVLDEPTGVDKQTVVDFFPTDPAKQEHYKFLLTKLLARFENSEIRNFRSIAFLQTPRLFEDEVDFEGTTITHDASNSDKVKNLVRLEGSYQKNSAGADEFSFTAKGIVEFTFPAGGDIARILKKIAVNSLTFKAVAGGSYRFDVDADAFFANFGVDVVFDISKINFKNIGLSFDLNASGFPIPKFDLSSLGVFPDIKFDGKGFLSSFPIRLNSFQTFKFPKIKLPSGDFALDLPEMDFFKLNTQLPKVDAAWLKDAKNLFAQLFSFVFDIDLGTLGDIEALKALKGQFLIGWSFRGGFVIGFKLQGPSSRGLHLDLFGALKLDVKQIDMCRVDKFYFLRLIDARLTIFGKELPSKTDFDFNGVIYARPGDKIAWFLAATRKGQTGPLNNLVLGVGQRVGPPPDPADRTVSDVLKKVKQVFDDNIVPCNGGENPVSKFYNPGRNWLAGSEDFIPKEWRDLFNLKFVFNDPVLYGINIEIVNYIIVDVLYKKLSESLGVYSAELQLAPKLRNQDFGGINVTFPNLGIDVYTNGDFKVDIGFPRTSNDWSRSCLIQLRSAPPLVGWAGFYFTKLSTASLSLFAQYLSKLPKDPHVPGSLPGDGVNIIQAGFAFRVGIGAYIDKGIFYVGASISIYGIMEGAFGFNKSDGALIKFIPDHFALRGRMGAIAELVGYVDFKIVKAAIYIILRVEFGLLLVVIKGKGLQPVPIYIEGEVRVEIDFTIACFSIFGHRICIVIHLAFGAFVRFQYTLGGDSSKQARLARHALRALAATPIIVQLGEIPVVYVPSIVKTGEIGNVLVHQFAINLFGTRFENNRLRFPEKNILKDNIMLPIFSAILASGPQTYSTVRKVFLEGINGGTDIVFDVSSYRPTIFAGRNDLAADMAFIQQHFFLTDAEFADFKAIVAPNPCATGALCPFRLIPAPISARIKVDAKNGTTFESDPANGFKVKLSGLFTDDAGTETPVTRPFKRTEEYSDDDIAEIETHFDDYMTQFLSRSNTRSLEVPPKNKDICEDAIIPEYFKLVGLLTLEAYFSFLAGKEANRQKENFDPPITLDKLFTENDEWKLNDHLEDIIGQLNYFYNNGLRLPDLQTPAPSAPYYRLLHQADGIRKLKQNPTPADVSVVFSKHDDTLPIHLEHDMFAGTGLTDFVAKGLEALSVNLQDINGDFTNVGEQIPYRLLNVTLPISNSNINTDKGQFRFFEIPKKIYHEFKTQKAGLKLHIASNTKPQDDVINHMPCANVEVSVRPHLIDGKLKCVELRNIFADDLNLMNRIKDEPDFIQKIEVYLKTVDNKNIVYLPLILAGEEKNTRLVKTNFSPRTHPPVIVAQTFRAFAVPNEKYVATLEEPELFARLLWEGVTTNDGGYFLFESDNSTLFAAIPPNAQEDIRLIFSFEAEIGKPFHSFSNSLKLSKDALGGRKIFDELDKSTHSLYGAILFERGKPVLEYHSKIPSHCFSFQLTRNKPAQQAIGQYLPVEFSLLNKTTGKLILSRDAVLPLMPQHERNDDGSPVRNADQTLKNDLWIYDHVTPLVALTADGSNRYAAVGQKFNVSFAVRDVFGFRALDLSKNVEYTHKYFDKLVPVNAWPFITTSYWFKEFTNNELAFELKIKAFDNGLKVIDKFSLTQIGESLDTIIAQISDVNVRISLNQGFTSQTPDLKANLLKALIFVRQNLDTPKPREFKLQFGLKVNADLKTKLNPTIVLKRDVTDDLFVSVSDNSSVWEYESIKSMTSEINLSNTTPDDSTIQLFDLAIATPASAGCPYVVGLSSEEGERRSIYLLNKGFLQIKPKETLPLDRTSYFAIKPYSNQLWSGSYTPSTPGAPESTFSRLGLDEGLSVILSKLEALLNPETVKTLERDQLDKLLCNKKQLVESELQTKTANIDSPDERGQEELRKEFRDLLLENLGNFFRYDGIVSITPVSIDLGALKDHRVSISLEKHNYYTLRSSKIDFRDPNPKWFVLFDQIQGSPFIDLDLQPRVTHVEFNIEPDAASPEIERSTWIQLIKPIELAPIGTIQTVPDNKWPRIVREFPPVPLVLNHAAEQVTMDGGTLTWNKDLGQWKYVISILDRYNDLDRMNVEIKTTSFKRLLKAGPVRNFKGFIAFWSTFILDERRKFVPDEFINDLDYQLTLPAQDAENFVPFTQPNSFTIERQGGIWSRIANATPYDVAVQKDGTTISIVVGGKGFNLFDIGDRVKSITSKITAFRNRRAKNDAFVYVTDTVEPATTATPHIAFFTPIRLRDGELFQSVYALMKEMKLPYKSTAKLLVNVADLEAHRSMTLPVIPIRHMEFEAGLFPANTAFDTTFDRYRNGFPSISVTIYNAAGDLNDLPIFNAVNIFTKVK